MQKSKIRRNRAEIDREITTPIKYLLSMELKDCGGDNLRKQLLLGVVSPPKCKLEAGNYSKYLLLNLENRVGISVF